MSHSRRRNLAHLIQRQIDILDDTALTNKHHTDPADKEDAIEEEKDTEEISQLKEGDDVRNYSTISFPHPDQIEGASGQDLPDSGKIEDVIFIGGDINDIVPDHSDLERDTLQPEDSVSERGLLEEVRLVQEEGIVSSVPPASCGPDPEDTSEIDEDELTEASSLVASLAAKGQLEVNEELIQEVKMEPDLRAVHSYMDNNSYHALPSPYKLHNGDREGDTASVKSDHSQRSIGDRHRSAIAEMYKASIERLQSGKETNSGLGHGSDGEWSNRTNGSRHSVNSSEQELSRYFDRPSSQPHPERALPGPDALRRSYDRLDYAHKTQSSQPIGGSTRSQSMDRMRSDYPRSQSSDRLRDSRPPSSDYSNPQRYRDSDDKEKHHEQSHSERYRRPETQENGYSQSGSDSYRRSHSLENGQGPASSDRYGYSESSENGRDQSNPDRHRRQDDPQNERGRSERSVHRIDRKNSPLPHHRKNFVSSRQDKQNSYQNSHRDQSFHRDDQMLAADRRSEDSAHDDRRSHQDSGYEDSRNSPSVANHVSINSAPSTSHHKQIIDTHPPPGGEMHAPSIRTPLVTTRTTPVTSLRTASKSRANVPSNPSNKEDLYRLQDLEDTVLSLRRVLNEREREIDELRVQQRSQNAELNQLKSTTNEEEIKKHELHINDLIKEKECLKTEIFKFRLDIGQGRSQPSMHGEELWEECSPDHTLEWEESNSDHAHPVHIDNYDPNNPHVLTGKIRDLEGQVADLQEVSETSVAKLAEAETEIRTLKEENDRLRADDRSLGVREENKKLKEELSKLKASGSGHQGSTDMAYMYAEVGQLREDLHTLRDRNHSLTQDNIKLTEYIRDLENRKELSTSVKLSDDSERLDKFRKERDTALEEVEYLREKLRRFTAEVNNKYGSSVSATSATSKPLNRDYSRGTEEDLEEKISSKKSYLSSAPSKYLSHSTSVLNSHERTFSNKSDTTPYRSLKFDSRSAASNPALDLTEKQKQLSRNADLDFTKYPSADSLIDDVLDDVPLPATRGKQGSLATRGQYKSSQQPQVSQGQNGTSDLLDDLSPPDPRDIKELQKMGLFDIKQYKVDFDSDLDLPDPSGRRKRKNSQASDSTDSILNELSNHLGLSHTDTREKKKYSETQVPTTASLDFALSPPPSPTLGKSSDLGSSQTLRPHTAKPIVTQTNKHDQDFMDTIGSRDTTFSTSGLVPKAPRTPGEVAIGDVVKFCRQGGKISRGMVKYVGHLPGKNDVYLGVELELEIGKHDGMYDGQRYFQCKPNRGVFVAFSKVVMMWGHSQ